ncbi:hypothetical protein C7T36_06615 [Rhodococcus sp. AD45-ID]|nr:hypothetical protein C7T36_06615 [Rhodococcus sp. AD45-ID]
MCIVAPKKRETSTIQERAGVATLRAQELTRETAGLTETSTTRFRSAVAENRTGFTLVILQKILSPNDFGRI